VAQGREEGEDEGAADAAADADVAVLEGEAGGDAVFPYVGPWALGRQPGDAAAYSTDSQSISWQSSSSSSSSSISEEVEAWRSDRHHQLDGEGWEQVEQQSRRAAAAPEMHHSDVAQAAGPEEDAAAVLVIGGGLPEVPQQTQQQHSRQTRVRHRQRHQHRAAARSHLLQKTIGRKALRHLVYRT
jgi:hypothetical protein